MAPSLSGSWIDGIRTLAAERGVHLARTVVLLPYANLLAPARAEWARRFEGFAPRFETTHNWAQQADLFLPGPDDLRFDHGRDWLTAQTLLERAGLGSQRALLAGRLVEQALQLAPLASARAPAQRADWLAQVAGVLPAVADGALRLEAAVARIAASWAATSAYASDVLFAPRVLRGVELLLILPGLQHEPLTQALARHWGDQAVTLAHPPQAPQGAIALHEAHDAEDEAGRAAACVLRHLREGRAPVALVAGDRLLVRRINALLAAQGVALRDETGWKLSTTHAAASVAAALHACAPRAGSDAVLAWIKLAPVFAGLDHRALEHRLRKDAVRHWHQAALLPEGGPLAAQVRQLRQPMQAARPLAAWLADLRALLQGCGLWPLLSQDAAGQAVIAALGLADEALAEWRAWPVAARRMPLAEFTHWVGEALEGANFHPPHPASAQVVVLPMAQLLGRSFAALVLPGADEQHLPAAPEPAGQWSAAQRTALGLPTRAQLQQEQAQAFALALAVAQVDLLWRRANDSGEALSPSPLVQALRLAQVLPIGTDARSARTVEAKPTLRPEPTGALLPLQPLSASSYEQLRACPYRFFALRQLGLSEEGELDVDIDKRDWGNWVHAVLRGFHEALRAAPQADRLALMQQAAEAVTQAQGLADEPGEFMPFEVAWPRLRDAYLCWLAEHEAGGAVYADGEKAFDVRRGPLQLRGRIDRIDQRMDGTELLIDYKTEARDKTKKRVESGSEETQLPFYALLSGSEAPRAAYLNLAEREEPRMFEVKNLQQLAADLHAGMAQDVQRIAAGAPLPALGEGSVCDWCEVRGLCRKDFWVN
ncbi:PD-(D/E)XK nuclease family protein [Comamonas badia]|uniref:PD-(D/E)XK nuclease family protein n=1 Tax=Comamonas badia TaxID=265291 RepID=UPI0004A43561|nr:PD-(D/E)XK nuclease family protein [Comamonas badia]